MRQMLGVLILGTMLAATAAAASPAGAADLGLPPIDPMGGAAALAPADEPEIQQTTSPYPLQHEENKDSGPEQ
jgi:hypothetical protein